MNPIHHQHLVSLSIVRKNIKHTSTSLFVFAAAAAELDDALPNPPKLILSHQNLNLAEFEGGFFVGSFTNRFNYARNVIEFTAMLRSGYQRSRGYLWSEMSDKMGNKLDEALNDELELVAMTTRK